MVPAAAAPTTTFVSAWEEFFRTVRRLRAREAGLARDGALTVAQYQLLEPLRSAPEHPVGTLAEAAGIAAPTATRMLDGLARDGLVNRRHSESDRRVVLIGLTPTGRAALAVAHERVEAFRRRIFEALEPEERERAAALLERLTEVLEAELRP